VENDFNFNFPGRERTTAALRWFFNGRAKKKAPTGDPNIPVWVRKAKDIQETIINKSDVVIDLDDNETGIEGLTSLMNRHAEREVTRGVAGGADGGEEDDDDEDYDYNFIKKPVAKPSGKNKAKRNQHHGQGQTQGCHQNWGEQSDFAGHGRRGTTPVGLSC